MAQISIPSYMELRGLATGSDQLLLGHRGEVVQRTRTDFKKRRMGWLPLSGFSSDIKESIIAIEDKRFYEHLGVDFIGMIRATLSMIQSKRVQGASTISMQVADLIDPEVLLGNRRIIKGSIKYKLIQIFRALALEMRWSKQEILTAYLNLIHLRGEFQGVPAFSYAFFDKPPQFLSQSESWIVASLVQKPNIALEKLKQRVCHYGSRFNQGYECSRSDRIIDQLKHTRASIRNEFNHAPHLARKLFLRFPQKSTVESYLDFALQKKVQNILEKNLSYLQKNNVNDAAAIVVDNKSGQVLAYVGAVARFSQAKDVDGADSPRQAGSTLKPFLYASALEKKLITPASIIQDDPTVLTWAGGLYRPTNYSQKFYGAVTVRQALASSLNVPAVKIVKMLGLSETYSTIKRLRLKDLKQPDFYGASIALGAVEIRLHELANIYRAIANNGQLSALRWSKNDDSIDDSAHQLMSPQVSFLIKSILSDSDARRIGFGWDSALETGFWTAVKTGTSKDLRDNWCVGFSSQFTVGIWAGNFSAEAMKGASGVTGAAPSWFEIMNYLHQGTKSLAPESPEGIMEAAVEYDWSTGQQREYFLSGTEPAGRRIEQGPENFVSITFPAKDSTLTINPHRNKKNSLTIFVRYNGKAPKGSLVSLDGKELGPAESPFKIESLGRGSHELVIYDSDRVVLDKVSFTVK